MSKSEKKGSAERCPRPGVPRGQRGPSACYTESEQSRFWSRVGTPDARGCRAWSGALNAEGRGRYTIRGSTRYAYVYALVMTGETVPPGVPVRHLCGNPSCCEPSHLTTEGGQSANNADTVRHGRHRSAILTPDDAQQIRHRLAAPAPPRQRDLADEYNVSPSAVSAVALGKTFQDVGGPRTRSRKDRGDSSEARGPPGTPDPNTYLPQTTRLPRHAGPAVPREQLQSRPPRHQPNPMMNRTLASDLKLNTYTGPAGWWLPTDVTVEEVVDLLDLVLQDQALTLRALHLLVISGRMTRDEVVDVFDVARSWK